MLQSAVLWLLEAKFEDDLLVAGQLHPFDQADQQLPVDGRGFQEPLRQFFRQVPLLLRRGGRAVQLAEMLLQGGAVGLDPGIDALEAVSVQDAFQLDRKSVV